MSTNPNPTSIPQTPNKIDTSKAPKWFSEPLDGKRELWACFGIPSATQGKVKFRPVWCGLFTSREEAEVNASLRSDDGWVWNGKPAKVFSLREAMFQARRDGDLGVLVKSYDHQAQKWVILAEYPANVPLNDELLDP